MGLVSEAVSIAVILFRRLLRAITRWEAARHVAVVVLRYGSRYWLCRLDILSPHVSRHLHGYRSIAAIAMGE